MPEIPKKIHFIWVGGPIPFKYKHKIDLLAVSAEKSGFEVNLWVDDSKNAYPKALDSKTMKIQQDLITPGQGKDRNLRIRLIDELDARMNNDPFYKSSANELLKRKVGRDRQLLTEFKRYLHREMVGFHNYASASDLLRYEILRQNGGYYFDTDTDFPNISNCLLQPDHAAFGMLINATCEVRTIKKDENSIPYYQIIVTGCNDIIASVPNNIILKNVLQKILINYMTMDNVQADSNDLAGAGLSSKNAVGYTVTKFDTKRYPSGETTENNSRWKQTIIYTGPNVLMDEIGKNLTMFINKKGIQNNKIIATTVNPMFFKNTAPDQLLVANIVVESNSDKTWMETKNVDEKKHAFEDHSISNKLFTEKRSTPVNDQGVPQGTKAIKK